MHLKLIDLNTGNSSKISKPEKQKIAYRELNIIVKHLYWESKNIDTKSKWYIDDHWSYYSISYTSNNILVWVSKKPVWIDIEKYKYRDTLFFDQCLEEEWKCFNRKSWANFYVIWTAKEALFKYLKLKVFEEMNMMQVVQSKACLKRISWIIFDKLITIKFFGEIYIIYSWKEWDNVYSICHKKYNE